MTTESLPLGVGRYIGRYELLHEIGAGGMATVYLGRARGVAGFERVVAIKCCHQQLRFDSTFVSMFLDEARLAAKIHHPNVVPVLDVGDAEALFLVMDYVEGHSLQGLRKAATKQKKNLPVGVVLRVALDALAGLHAAHELRDAEGKPLNLVHRDVSAQNILVGVDGVARITDFGIAKAEERQTITPTGQIKGRFAYMAPELLAGEEIDRRADVFAMGVLLWEGLTREALFRGSNPEETLDALVNREVPKPSTLNADVPAELDAVVLKALERKREDRYESAGAFIDAIEKCAVRPASTREVSLLVQELLSGYLERRREVIRRITSERRAETSAALSSSDVSNTLSLRALGEDGGSNGALSVRRRPRRQIGTVLLGVGGAALLLGGIALGLAARGGSNANPGPVAATAPATIAAPPGPAPHADAPAPPPHVDAPPPTDPPAAVPSGSQGEDTAGAEPARTGTRRAAPAHPAVRARVRVGPRRRPYRPTSI